MPPTTVKPVGKVAEKWARRVAGASQDYADGASAAGGRWATGAAGGAANYKQGVAAAASAGKFEKGVSRVGAEKYSRGIASKGAVRYGPGAAAAEGDFTKAIGPVLDVIARTDMPMKGPRGAECNYQRSAAIGKALRQWAEKR
jgi:hypothetical protein